MFYYYGRKHRIISNYPQPKYDLIIEPFAGSAAYSMNYYDRDVILIEKDIRIANLWSYLIQVTPDEILSLPLLFKGESLNDDKFSYLTDNQKSIIGLYLNPGSSQPKKSPGNFCAWNINNRLKLSNDVKKVKHWKVINSDYSSVHNYEATWFIDPPYQGNGGKYYKHGNKNFNYNSLKNWTLERNGEVIVCENSEANWMDFKPLININGQRHKTKEVIFYKYNKIID